MNLIIEKLAAIEHEQWMVWARALMEKEGALSEERKERWRKLFVTYEELPEQWKEFDRYWAIKVKEAIEEFLEHGT